jgi:hypothetical protein
MTFQVGLVGSDGVLLASDRRYTRQDTCRSAFQADKIVFSKGLAYCTAGDEIAEAVGLTLLEFNDTSASNEAYRQQLELRSRAAVEGRSDYYGNGMLLIARCAAEDIQLWTLTVSPLDKRARRITDKFCQGDNANTASFFGEAYFPKDHASRPISSMRMLAAHTVLMAGKTNPCYIEGLEILECRKDGFTRLNDKEIADLVKHSATIDDYSRSRLLVPLA